MHAIARDVINSRKSFDHNLQFFSFECITNTELKFIDNYF